MSLMSDRVTNFLRSHPRARGNDLYLLGQIWREDLKILKSEHYKVHVMDKPWGTINPYIYTESFLDLLENKKLSNPESVRRSRQKIQQNNIMFRDPEVYKHRQKMSQEFREAAINGENLGDKL
jgi:hypothetical protein